MDALKIIKPCGTNMKIENKRNRVLTEMSEETLVCEIMPCFYTY